MKKPYSKNQRSGFTLIELLVTITIVVILAGLSLGGFKYVTAKQANSQAEIQIKLLENAIEEFKLDTGEFPKANNTNALFQDLYFTGSQRPDENKIYIPQLDPDNNKQGWTEGSGKSVKIVDPWGNEFIYRNPGTVNPDFDLLSMGKDGRTDQGGRFSKDDLTNY